MKGDSQKHTHIDRREEKFRAFLTSNGLRKTPERFEILKCVLETSGHFDADTLYKMLEDRGFHVSRATVYNTIELLCSGGVVRKLLFDTHQARYELAEKTHSHMVCTQCGEITEIDLEQIDDRLASMKFEGFTPAYVSTCIYGICDSCREKTNTQPNTNNQHQNLNLRPWQK